MVAASKMRKAQHLALDGRPYAKLLNAISAAVNEANADEKHPLLQHREVQKELVILISTDKGPVRSPEYEPAARSQQVRPGEDSLPHRRAQGCPMGGSHEARVGRGISAQGHADLHRDEGHLRLAIEKFLDGTVDKVSVVVTRFVNTLTQVPVVVQLLPVAALPSNVEALQKIHQKGGLDVTFEPNPAAVLDALLPYYAHFAVYRAVVEARARSTAPGWSP